MLGASLSIWWILSLLKGTIFLLTLVPKDLVPLEAILLPTLVGWECYGMGPGITMSSVRRDQCWISNIPIGLEVILADGTVLDMLRTLKKDNCGYHLPHIFIGALCLFSDLNFTPPSGSEGTLGYITKVALQLYPAPQTSFVVFSRVISFLCCFCSLMLPEIKSFTDIPQLFNLARSSLGEVLSAFEIIDSHSLELLADKNPHLVSRSGRPLS